MKLKEDHFYEIANINTKLELTNQEHETKINNAMRNHKNELEQRQLHFNNLLQEKLDALSQKQREQLDNLTSKHEESLQGSNCEIESYYRTQVDTVKGNLEQLLGEKSQQLENVNQYALELKVKLSELQTEFDTKSESYESRISEIQSTLKSEKGTSEKLESELENWRLKCSEDQRELARHMTDLKERLHNLEVHKTHLEVSNEKLKDELDELSSHWVEKHETLILEKDTLIKEQQEHSAQQEIKAGEEIRTVQENLKELMVSKSDLENAKSELEGKLSVIENTMQEILQANEELNENLEKSQQQTMKINQLEHKLTSQTDELSTIKSNTEEKDIIINSLETRCTELDKDAQEKSMLLLDTESHLKEAKEKFNMLRNEAKNKIKELKDDIDHLKSEHSNDITTKETKYSEQLQAMKAAIITLQQDLQAKCGLNEKYRSNLVDLENQMKDQEESQTKLEESFRIRFQERQQQTKAFLLKTKEDFHLKIKKMEDEYEMKVSDMLKQRELGVEDVTASLETLKAQQMEELKARHKESLAECNEEWETKTRQIKDESDSKLTKVTQDLENNSKIISDAQKQINQLSNDLEVQSNLNLTQTENDKATLKILEEGKDTEISNLHAKHTAEMNEHQEQITKLETRIAGLTKALEEEQNAITEQKECLLGEYSDKFKELEQQVTAVSEQLTSTAEKHQCEIEEKSQLLKETTERIALLERTNSSMEGMVDSLNESCKGKEDKIELIHAEYEAQLEKLSNDNRQSVADITIQLEERRVAITELEKGAKLMRDDHAKKVTAFEDERTASLKQITDEYEKKVSEMRTNDQEAQKALCDAKDQLSQELQTTLDRKESEFNEEIQVLNQKLMAASNQANMSEDKLQLMLDEEVKQGESKYSSLSEKHSDELRSMQTTWHTKQDELKQRYTAKLKEFKSKETEKLNELNAKHANILEAKNIGIIELENKIKCEVTHRESLASELSLANNKLPKLEESCCEYSAQISHLTTEIKSLQKTLTAKESEIEANVASKMDKETFVEELNDKLQSQEKEYSHQLEHLQQASDALTKELKISKTYCESSDNRIKESSDNRIKELEMELKENSLNIQNCRSNLKTEIAEHEKTTKQCESLELQISELSKQLDSRVSEHDDYIINIREKHGEELRNLSIQMETEHSEELRKQSAQMETEHSEELRKQSTQLETEHNAKIAELKKKAETYITQMKKQLLDDKSTAIAQQINDKEAIISEQAEKICLIETDSSSLNAKLVTVQKDFISQAEEIIKLTEDYSDAEKSLADIKSEKDELNLKIQLLESNTEMIIEEKNNEISKMVDSKSKLQEEFMILKRDNNKNMEITERHHQDEIARLKNEYENELQERDISNTSRMKQLLKEVNIKMSEKEREFEESFSGVLGEYGCTHIYIDSEITGLLDCAN